MDTAPNPELMQFIGDFLRERGISEEGLRCVPLAGDGSQRSFWRIHIPGRPDTSVAVENTPADALSEKENHAYLMIGRHLFERGVPVPEMLAADPDKGWFILEDMGDRSLQSSLDLSSDRVAPYQSVVETLLEMQVRGSEGFDGRWTCQTETYDQWVMRRYESDYFLESFLTRYLAMTPDRSVLEVAFDYLAEIAAGAPNRFLLHRDFQSRNIMVREKGIGILDWQGARFGPLAYDLASLLIDPYAGLSGDEQRRIYGHYLELLREILPAEEKSLEQSYPYLALQRNLQILGAFSFLSRSRGKSYFEAYIPGAVKTLRALLKDLNDPHLSPVRELAESLPYPD
jgi:aminoglycoside/choline kinase family phosphotransferase